ncbi:aminotransferase class V-fold PLP-dependent enzyme [Microbacterium rhizomatis]|uniref:Cysteine desulfurase n=1 Tax=Microbacterium rhizomatis TaxID=1631477 RepID=A0A5J5IWI3_9MICO|nr:SufS family cysteine desulfurase [Microbacterium rhizomatis]KAA9105043.1 SufS family cysteine desulfurase [Microbacterium rhizomatis]
MRTTPPRDDLDLALTQSRRDFASIGHHPGRAYLDSAATAQRPAQVLDAERAFVERDYAAVHRGASEAVGAATEAFETARHKVAGFVGAAADEIVWTENATDAINVVALGLSDASTIAVDSALALRPGDEILVTEAEHHANLLPWQKLAARTGAVLRWAPVGPDGTWSIDGLRDAASDRTRLIAFAHVSNVTGLIAPVADVAELARSLGAMTLLDACQSVPHLPVDLGALGVDFAAFSGHKMLGPTGIGALYGRAELLNALPPARTGGSTITTVTMTDAEFLPAPQRFEAGTQPVSQAVGLGAAVDYLDGWGMDRIHAHETELAGLLTEAVAGIPGVRLIGPPPGAPRAAIVSVDVEGVHAHDVGQFLDSRGVSVRVGHHCAQPLHRALGISASTRASAYLYTTPGEVDRFGAALAEVRAFFGADR